VEFQLLKPICGGVGAGAALAPAAHRTNAREAAVRRRDAGEMVMDVSPPRGKWNLMGIVGMRSCCEHF
jgi:hypothetical protein